jgi:hypothetical protein
LNNLAKWAQADFKLAHKPSESTISRIMENKDKFLSLSKQDQHIRRIHVVTNDVLEEALVTWVLQKQHQQLLFHMRFLSEKGRQFAEQLSLSNSAPQFSG